APIGGIRGFKKRPAPRTTPASRTGAAASFREYSAGRAGIALQFFTGVFKETSKRTAIRRRQMKTLEIALIGAGRGGTALLDLLHKDPLVKIIGVADTKANESGIKLARRLKIPVTSDFRKLLNHKKLDLVINITGKKEVEKTLAKIKPEDLEVMGGTSAYVMWQLIEARI